MPPIDWLNSPIESNVSEILARKRRAAAIEALRKQLEGRAPSEKVRLQLADLLIQAGRPAEACPILVTLADELQRDGFVAKAIAILKRVDKVEPGRADVAARMTALVQEQQRQTGSSGAAATPRPAPTPRPMKLPLFGMEEIGDAPSDDTLAQMAKVDLSIPPPGPPFDAPAAEVQPLPEPPPPANEAPPAEASPAEPAPTVDVVPPAEPTPSAEPALPAEPIPQVTTAPELDLAPPATPEPEPAKPSGGRLRSVFRRFLSSLVDDEPKPAEPAAAAEAPEAPAEAPEVSPSAPAEVAAPEAPPAASEEPVAASPETAPASTEAAPPATEVAPPSPTEESGIDRFKGALRWFLARDDEADKRDEPPAAVVPEAPAEETPYPAATPVLPDAVPAGSGPTADSAAEEPSLEPEPEVEPDVEIQAEDAEAPLAASPAQAPESLLESLPATTGGEGLDESAFQEQLLDLVQDVLQRPADAPAAAEAEPLIDVLDEAERPVRVDARHYLDMSRRLLATPLFGELAQDELMAVVEGLTLRTFDPGDVLVSEGAPGNSLFVLTTGDARVYVRNPIGRNVEVARLREGEWFGEVSALSGRPRSATVVAADWVECLELSKPTLDAMAATHPRVRDRLEAAYIARASSPENAAVRAVVLDAENTRQRANEVLLAHFGESRWDPKMQLRLADALLRAGKEEDAVAVLVGLADELVRQGFPEKAVAILKKIEGLQKRYIEEVNLAPLKRPRREPVAAEPAPPAAAAPVAAPAPAAPPRGPRTAASFGEWLVDVVRDQVKKAPTLAPEAAPAATRSYGRGLRASPLFEGLAEDELLALVQQLRLVPVEPGEILISEGEPGASVFILATGVVKVFVRTPRGDDARLAVLRDGAFFGEMAAISGQPRRATVIAATRGELLELTHEALAACTARHPRMREVLEAISRERAQSAEAAQLRGQPPA